MSTRKSGTTSQSHQTTTSIQDRSDDKDEKYSTVKQSTNRMFRRIFMFIAVAFMATTYVCFDDRKIQKFMRGIKGALKSAVTPSLEKLEQERLQLDQKVRDIKETGIIMETDEESLKVTGALQDITREVLKKKYGDHPNYRVKVDLEFPSTVPDFEKNGPRGTIMIEMGPIDYIPVSVYNWLEIARTWKSGTFHRNASHVLQATTHAAAVKKSLAFQEYSDKHPHKKGTVGYCGRPSGPCWYVSIIDNIKNHGPGSQQKKNPHEADANFGRIVSGMDDVVPRIHSIPQGGWLDEKNQVLIKTMTILVPTGPGGAFSEWVA